MGCHARSSAFAVRHRGTQMSACEHCWETARLRRIEYHDQVERAEREKSPCTQDTIEGAKLRAGQWWDDETQTDRRNTRSGE